MDLTDFLRSLVAANLMETALVAVTVAGLVWGFIEVLDKWVKTRQQPPKPGVPGDVKFVIAVVGSLVLPYAAYFLLSWRLDQPVDGNGLFLAGVTAFLVSQILHRLLEGGGTTVDERNILDNTTGSDAT